MGDPARPERAGVDEDERADEDIEEVVLLPVDMSRSDAAGWIAII